MYRLATSPGFIIATSTAISEHDSAQSWPAAFPLTVTLTKLGSFGLSYGLARYDGPPHAQRRQHATAPVIATARRLRLAGDPGSGRLEALAMAPDPRAASQGAAHALGGTASLSEPAAWSRALPPKLQAPPRLAQAAGVRNLGWLTVGGPRRGWGAPIATCRPLAAPRTLPSGPFVLIELRN